MRLSLRQRPASEAGLHDVRTGVYDCRRGIEHFPELTPEEVRKAVQKLSPEARRELLQVLTQQETESNPENLRTERSAPKRKQRGKR
jgi:hypothetical protein